MPNIFYVSPWSLQSLNRVTAFILRWQTSKQTQKHKKNKTLSSDALTCFHETEDLSVLRLLSASVTPRRSPLHFIYTSIKMRQNACHGPHVKSIRTNFVLTRKRFLPGNRKMHHRLQRSYYELFSNSRFCEFLKSNHFLFEILEQLILS